MSIKIGVTVARATLVVLLGMSTAWAVIVPEWRQLPLACLPGRAAVWEHGVAESSLPSCHGPQCPDPSGVTSMAEFRANANMPEAYLNKCPLPKCPAGTKQAGTTLPEDGNCDADVPPPASCPGGLSAQTYTGPYQTSSWQYGGNSTGSITYTGCMPLCQGGGHDVLYAVSLDRQTMDWLDPAWTAESVNHSRVTIDGRDIMFVCSLNVATNDCLSSDSKVVMADGSTKPIGDLTSGEKLMGPDGDVAVASITHIDGSSLYYRINGFALSITGDHPVLTTKGWKAADDTKKYADVVVGRLEVGDVLVTQKGKVKITSIVVAKQAKGQQSVNVSTLGDKPFYVDGVTVKPFKSIALSY